MKMEFYRKVGKKIQDTRRAQKMSQKELAEKMGKGSATYINLIESGKRKVSLESMTKIAKALGTTLNTFLDENYKEMNPHDLLELALISDTELHRAQRKMIMEFVEFIRKRGYS